MRFRIDPFREFFAYLCVAALGALIMPIVLGVVMLLGQLAQRLVENMFDPEAPLVTISAIFGAMLAVAILYKSRS